MAAPLLSEFRVEGIPEAVTQHVERDDRDDDAEAREQGIEGAGADKGLGRGNHHAPARHGSADSQSEEGKARLGKDCRRDAHGDGDDQGGDAVGQQVLHDDAETASAINPAGLDVFLFLQLQHGTADKPCRLGPGKDTEGNVQVSKSPS